MSAQAVEFDPVLLRRFEIACERERLAHHELTPDEVSRVVVATKGERINYDHIGKVLAEKLKLKEGR